MGKQIYFYIIVKKDNGEMLVKDYRLSFYWHKDSAKRECEYYKGYCVVKMKLETINDLILKSKCV